MLDFAIFAVTFVIILVGAVLYLYPVSQCDFQVSGKSASLAAPLSVQNAARFYKLCQFSRENVY